MAVEQKSTSMEIINILEAKLHSKIEGATATEEKSIRMEESLKKVMEPNRKHAKTNTDLSITYVILNFDNERLQSKIQWLRAKI